MLVVFILGTAGSGKSLLTYSFAEWLRLSKQNVIKVNLDPGTVKMPYLPDIDIREYFDIFEIMNRYRIGPNGALIMAAEFIADHSQMLSKEIEDMNPSVVLVDTPGQLEPFAFRSSGSYIVNELTKENKAIIYLFDSVFSSKPSNFISNLFISAAIYNRFLVPQVHILSRCDLIPPEAVERIMDWPVNPKVLETAVEDEHRGTERILNIDLMHAIYRLGLNFFLIPVSAKMNKGYNSLNMALERFSTGGEKYTD